jgi:Aminotransferase class I and II
VGGYTQQHDALEAALARLKGASAGIVHLHFAAVPHLWCCSAMTLPTHSSCLTAHHAGCMAMWCSVAGTPSAGKEAALLFPTGFAANAGTISALAGGGGCHIFSDALNHASIIDGARLAVRQGARLHVYRHSDMQHLEQLLLNVPQGESSLAPDLATWTYVWAPCQCKSIIDIFSWTRHQEVMVCICVNSLQGSASWWSQTACSAWTATGRICGAWQTCGAATASCSSSMTRMPPWS